MLEVRDMKIRNFQLCYRFCEIKALSEIWHYRLLKFSGKAFRQSPATLSRLLLTVSVDNRVLRGLPFI